MFKSYDILIYSQVMAKSILQERLNFEEKDISPSIAWRYYIHMHNLLSARILGVLEWSIKYRPAE